MVLTGRAFTRLRYGGELLSQLTRLTATTHLVYKGQRVVRGEVLRAEPPQSPQQVRNMVIFFAAENHFGRIINDFLDPRQVLFSAVTVNRDTVPDLREDQGVDQRGDNDGREVPPEM